jgi:ATP-dependent helicase/nuclease subunit A
VSVDDTIIKYTPEQVASISYRGGALLVSAAAGSGKTKVLVERLLSYVDEGVNIDEFLVITYTRAAALELRERIYDELLKKLTQSPENSRLRRQVMLCKGASIDTIHTFCSEICPTCSRLSYSG